MASDYGRKVARAAQTGGGVTARGKRPLGWYFTILLIFAIGIPLTVVSRSQHLADSRPNSTDHFRSALGFYVCDKFAEDLPNNSNSPDQSTPPPAIYTLGEGLIHAEPSVERTGGDATLKASVSGKNATLAKFVQLYTGLTVTNESLQLPTETQPHNNGDVCGDKPAKVKIAVWKSDDSKSPTVLSKTADVRLKNNQLITIAFVSDGVTIPKPPSKSELPDLANKKGGASQSDATTTTATSLTSTSTTIKK